MLLPLFVNPIDKLMYHSSRPLASRVVGRSHLEGLTLKEMEGYLNHHLKIAGIKEQRFAEEALLAIHQGSGGLLCTQENSTFSNIGLEGIERGDK